jgi:hypothetical protein
MPPAVRAQGRPHDAVVFIRIVGDVTAVVRDEAGQRQEVELPNVEFASGSGLVISPFGHVLTNHHVIAGGETQGRFRGRPATVTLTVRRIDVQLPGSGQDGERVPAAVLASDPDLDLAVLTVAGNDMAYVPFGDSDAVKVGHGVAAVGYPLGDALDLGRPNSDAPPAATTTTGEISALREDAMGAVRFLQTTAPLNRGNSGGPLVDRDGFAVGVVQLKVRDAEGIGFAIPINVVKDFLGRNGVDTALPSSRMFLGAPVELPDKLIAFQPPHGFQDAGPARTLVDSGSSWPTVALHIDRVASPWTLERLEETLRSGNVFERSVTNARGESEREERVLRGQATGRAEGRPLRMMYALFDLGDEKVIARYVGSAEQIAFNESVLAASLASIRMRPMLTPPAPLRPQWIPVSDGDAQALIPVLPAGWRWDGGQVTACAGLPAPRLSLSLSPQQDFTMAFRAAAIDTAVDAARAVQQCKAGNVTATERGYRYTYSRLGIAYTVEGEFKVVAGRLVQLEMVAPTHKVPAVRELFTQWIEQFR